MIDFPQLDFIPIPDEDDKPRKKATVRVYTADLETDPFQHGRYPQPFVAGFYDGKVYSSFWGEDCVTKLFAHIATLPHGIVFIHNGGKFDLYYCMAHIRNHPALIINGRIVRTYCKSGDGPNHPHEVRDSYAIMPFALEKYKKTKIDYSHFEKPVREKHRAEITAYLGDDCRDLWDLCRAFVDEFGTKLTVGSTAMRELKKLHPFESLGPIRDESIRSNYYYGGRVECFKTGVLKGNWKVFDVNSMYPFVMREFLHPIESPEAESKTVRKSTCFVSVQGKNYGAFPIRTKQGLRFDVETGTFHVSIHEFEVALSTGLFVPEKILRCINFKRRNSFARFVDTFYDARNLAKSNGDTIHALFYKYILNSAYGKFAQNPRNYLEYCITDGSANLTSEGWKPHEIDSVDRNRDYIIWKRIPGKDEIMRLYNVATGASITGAARAVLLEAIAKSDTPIYCDTDSLICRDLPGCEKDADKLGAWKLEATGNRVCVVQKKTYALFKNGKPVKQASKGVRITADEIEQAARGKVVTYRQDAPSYHLDGSYSFIQRRVRKP